MVENEDLFTDMIRPGSGCDLAEGREYGYFAGIWKLTGGNPCKGCFTKGYCGFMKKYRQKDKDQRVADFGKHAHKTNAELAAELGVSKRQIAKMRKRGKL
jgi:hypothetical protein